MEQIRSLKRTSKALGVLAAALAVLVVLTLIAVIVASQGAALGPLAVLVASKAAIGTTVLGGSVASMFAGDYAYNAYKEAKRDEETLRIDKTKLEQGSAAITDVKNGLVAISNHRRSKCR